MNIELLKITVHSREIQVLEDQIIWYLSHHSVTNKLQLSPVEYPRCFLHYPSTSPIHLLSPSPEKQVTAIIYMQLPVCDHMHYSRVMENKWKFTHLHSFFLFFANIISKIYLLIYNCMFRISNFDGKF